MKQLELGNFNITRIVESVGPAFELNFLLPDANPEILEQYSTWLKPAFVDPKTDILLLSFHSYLVRTSAFNILVDTCVGNNKERPGFPDMHKLDTDYLALLSTAGISPEQVDFVMCTHMHPDHVGWNTRLDNGQWVPTFPNAKYLFGKAEYEAWEYYHNNIAGTDEDPVPPPVSKVLGLSFTDSVLPVVEAGRAVMIEDGHEVDKGFTVEAAPGHTPGNFIINLSSREHAGVLSGDLLHHPIQLLHPEWSSTFCSDPETSAKTRFEILDRIAETDTVIMPAHFPSPTWGHVCRKGDGFTLNPL